MNEMSSSMSFYVGKSIEVAKHALGKGIAQMWSAYSQGALSGNRPQFPDEVARLSMVCDYLNSVRLILPVESQRGLLSEHGLEEMRRCIGDFAGLKPTQRQMSFFAGYRLNPDYRPEYDESDLDKLFLFPALIASADYADRRINEIVHSNGSKRIRLGPVDFLLDHGKEEIVVAQWGRFKFGRGYHQYVAGRVVTTDSDSLSRAEEMIQSFNIMPETFLTTMEHVLF